MANICLVGSRNDDYQALLAHLRGVPGSPHQPSTAAWGVPQSPTTLMHCPYGHIGPNLGPASSPPALAELHTPYSSVRRRYTELEAALAAGQYSGQALRDANKILANMDLPGKYMAANNNLYVNTEYTMSCQTH